MRHFSNLPPNYGSRRFERCPPSHHEMALSPHLAQASAQAPRPSRPTPPSTVTLAQVSPHHQRGSTMPSAAAPAAHSSLNFTPFVSMGGERSPRAAVRSLEWVDDTLARYHRGGNAIAEICGPSGTFLSPPRAIREHGGGMSPSAAAQLLGWVDGTLARFLWGVNAISFPSPHHVL